MFECSFRSFFEAFGMESGKVAGKQEKYAKWQEKALALGKRSDFARKWRKKEFVDS